MEKQPNLDSVPCNALEETVGLPSAVRVPAERADVPHSVRYQKRDRIARGGLGEVFLADDQELQRVVALKEMRAECAYDPQLQARFLREAEILGRLEHPGIVPVHGAGRYPDGRPYYAMRFVRQGNLQEAIREFHEAVGTSGWAANQLRFRKLLGQFIAACNAVDYAHSKGIVHRDLKPANIMLDKHGEVYVVDWGLAKVSDQEEITPASSTEMAGSGQDTALTQAGSVIGTYAYMSPEQALGLTDQIDARTDVYALGAALYELCTNQSPHQGATANEVHDRVVSGRLQPARAIAPHLPKPLESICRKAMARTAADRYPTVAALRQDLESWLADQPVAAHQELWLETAARQMRLHRTLTRAIAVAVLIALVISGVVWQYTSQQRREDAVRSTVEGIRTADLPALPGWLRELRPHRRQARPLLIAMLDEAEVGTPAHRNVVLALAIEDEQYLDAALEDLLVAPPADIVRMCDLLRPWEDAAAKRMWARSKERGNDSERRLPMAVVLAQYTPGDSRWTEIREEVARSLVQQNPFVIKDWIAAIQPAGSHLLPLLISLNETELPTSLRANVALAIGTYAARDIPLLTRQYADCDPGQISTFVAFFRASREAAIPSLRRVFDDHELPELPPQLRDKPASGDPHSRLVLLRARQGRAAVALLALEDTTILDALRDSPDPTVRTWIAELAAEAGVSVPFLIKCWDGAETGDQRQLVLWSLGNYAWSQLQPTHREQWLSRLRGTFLDDPSAGVHASIEWLLRRWKQDEVLKSLQLEVADRTTPTSSREWFVNSQGQLFSVIAGPGDMLLGATDSEWFAESNEQLFRAHVGRTFAVSQCEVTVAQFQRLMGQHASQGSHFSLQPDCPATHVNWYEAARYCRLLSEREGVAGDQMCFPQVNEIVPGMVLPDDYLSRTGYRLPTEAEWEHAARAGARTRGSFGCDLSLAGAASWHLSNSGNVSHPVGSLLPNAWGLFDCYGNVWEWTTGSRHYNHMPPDDIALVPDDVLEPEIVDHTLRVARGSGFSRQGPGARASIRERHGPSFGYPDFGFRIVRTISLAAAPAQVTSDWSLPAGQAGFLFHGEGAEFELCDIPAGIQVEPQAVRAPATVHVSSSDGALRPFSFIARAKNRSVAFELRGVVGQPVWDIEYFSWPSGLSPERQNHPDFESLAGLPAIRRERGVLDFEWKDQSPGDDVPADHFGARARSGIELPAGFYELFLRFDEGAALRLNGATVYDGRHNVRTIPATFWRQVQAGNHSLDLTYFERAGGATLHFQLRRIDAVVRIPQEHRRE